LYAVPGDAGVMEAALEPIAETLADPNPMTHTLPSARDRINGAIKARGSYDPHHEAGQMTATTNCCDVEIVLAMWASSTDAQVCINFY
jgi:hypothetical protein